LISASTASSFIGISAPDGFAAFIRTDYARMREAAKLAGLEPK
jgi:hypothetical protein